MQVLARYMIVSCLATMAIQCKKNEEEIPAVVIDNGGITYASYPKDNIASLHANIFAPTCANSGCHDGTFSPDFRTIQSAYNTLVMHPVIKNDSLNTYTYRVVPGDAISSVLYNRLTEDIDGNSGIMPLYSGEAWAAVKQEHINNIVSWINNGAQDIFGNPYQAGNKAPQMQGVVAIANGNVIARASNGQIEVPASVSDVTLWFSFSDDELNPADLQTNILKFSPEIYDFESATELNLQTDQTITETGYFGNQVTFTHRFNFDPSIFNVDEAVFFRVYLNDGENDAEIPSNGSPDYIKLYFSLKRI